MKKRRIPLSVVQEAVTAVLSSALYDDGVAVCDGNQGSIALPCVTLGEFVCKLNDTKTESIYDMVLKIHIWSSQRQLVQVNDIADTIVSILATAKLDLRAAGFVVIEQGCKLFESLPEQDNGSHGMITFQAKIQTLGGYTK